MTLVKYGPRTMESGSQGDYYTVMDVRPDGDWMKAADVEAVLGEAVKVIDLLHQGYRCEDEVDHRVCERAQRLLDTLRGQS